MADLTDIQAAETIKIAGADSAGVEGNYVNVDTRGNLLVGASFQDTGGLDAFGRLRASNPESIFETTFEYDAQPLLFSSTTASSGTVAHNSNLVAVELTATTLSGSSAILQSKQYFRYHPGKSQMIVMTGNLGGAVSGCRRRIGQFDANNGFFFELDTVLKVSVRSSTSGVAVDTSVPQSSWNLDRMDGTGASGVTINPSLQQIFFIDYQWLGAGRVRFGFVVAGRLHYCHEMNHANTLSTVYSRTATLPLRVECANTAVTLASTTLRFTCATVVSEGGFINRGIVRRTSNGTTSKSVGGSGTLVPVLSLRKKTSMVNVPIKIEELQLLMSTVDDGEMVVLINPTLTGASWSDLSGAAQRDVASTAVSGGTEVYGSYVRGAGGAASTTSITGLLETANLILGSDLAGTSDIVTIALRNITSASTAFASLVYREIL